MLPRADNGELLAENTNVEVRIDIEQLQKPLTFEQEIADSIATLRKADLKDKARYTPIPFGILISLASMFAFAYSIYRFAISGYNPGISAEYLQRYNNNTGKLPWWFDQPLLDKMNFTTADMNFTCGAEYPLTNVCFNLFTQMSDDAVYCANTAIDLCRLNRTLSSYYNTIVSDTNCGSLYPLKRVCDFVSIVGYPLLTCAWSANAICEKAEYENHGSLSNPSGGILTGMLAVCLIVCVAGIGLGCVTNCFRPRDLIRDIDEEKRNKLRGVAAKITVDIKDDQSIGISLNTLKERYKNITECQQAFLEGFDISQKDRKSQYRLFHGYIAPNGKQIQGDGDHECIKKILEYAGLPVLGKLKIGKTNHRFFAPVDDYDEDAVLELLDENSPLLKK